MKQMSALFESEYWKTGIIWLVMLLVGVVIVLTCVKGWSVWRERFGVAPRKIDKDRR
ncbi:hypothetical protein [Acetobacter peroxydans]|jgi:uncharacterized protein (DUF983 family)|uniref:hypothetical protein n=1 Tax=Acetobacter peroxydans TaxID=104098 RepID=UPI0023576F94|nr:hypothetical protein [Acetobacter peroxydans]MCI1410945.1 hypothetical protein [Acetobacter peroxydans]MCI1440397.1 hypothetical protein [Acetobacter peroxydans]MCI1566204.1 hypothetical protein [Acetobacter peroxydans]MCI1724204.1 hypothetical protein [Acetobacter peroxydans]